jgi:DNA-binding transcriptional ArsR family regulator
MSVQAMTWAFEQQVTPHAKLVLLALANRANHETGVCHPGQELIARECSMSGRTVRRHLKHLEDEGFITRRARMLPDGRGRTSDEYRLSFYQPDRLSERSGPTGQKVQTNRTKSADQPDSSVLVTVREPKENRKLRTSCMSDDWEPEPQNLQRLIEKHPTADVKGEVENFRDYWISKGERRADWNASFRTWIRNSVKFQQQNRKPTSVAGLGTGGVY